jgi:glycosyltransferase 2 family protein
MTSSAPASSPSPLARAAARYVRIAVALLLVIGLVAMVRGMNPRLVARTLAEAKVPYLLLAACLPVAQVMVRGLGFRVLLLPVVRLSRLQAVRYYLAGSATSSVIPGRAGDLLRIYLLKRDHDVPITATVATLLVEKLVDVAAMFALLAPAPWLLSSLPTWVGRSLGVVAGFAGALLLAALLLATRRHPPRWLAGFHAGLAAARRPALLATAFGSLLAAWVLDFACLLLVIRALGIEAPAAYGLLVLLAVNLALALPAMPANLGSFELAALLVLTPLAVPAELGLALGLLFHVVLVLPPILLALLDGRTLSRIREARAQAQTGELTARP